MSGSMGAAAGSRLSAASANELKTFVKGLCSYYWTGEANQAAWTDLLNHHCRTNGLSSDRLAKVVRMLRRPRPLKPVSGVLGHFSVQAQSDVVASLEKNGYYVFDNKLPATLCDELEHFARKTPAVVEGWGSSSEDRVIFDERRPVSKTYRIQQQDLVTERAMQRLMADPILLGIAEQYLRAHPILCGTDMWWSPAFGTEPGADAAQLFHFDFDGAPIWIKVFVYLTDVGPEQGPHVFVRGSHKAGHPAAAELMSRGYVRIPDEDIVAAFGSEALAELGGPRGTVFVADTRGFHKGKLPTNGYRLVAQLFFCCPQFNVHSPRQKLPTNIDPMLTAAISENPRVFERYPT